MNTCICRWVTPTANLVDVLILQHPLETGSAKGSARLLDMSLSNSRLVVGEAFDAAQLQTLLHEPIHDPVHGAHHVAVQPVLLYPDSPEGMAKPAMPDQTLLRTPSALRLVVLDGTWRKSRKMLYLNPLLQALPRLALVDVPASHYLIRKAHRTGQLSTLEATCRALAQLEESAERYQPLLDAFDGFVQQQAAYFRRDSA